MCIYLDNKIFSRVLKKQIRRLVLTVVSDKYDLLLLLKMCCRIFCVFKNITHLTFSESSYQNIHRLLFGLDDVSRYFTSSTLCVLNIKVQCFSLFLYLVDDRFNQLHTLIVDVTNPVFTREDMANKVCSKTKSISSIFFWFF